MLIEEKPSDNKIKCAITADLLANKKISVNCGSPVLANEIRDLAMSMGKIVLIYTGKDEVILTQLGIE